MSLQYIVQTHADLKKLVKPSHKDKKLKPSDYKNIFSKKEGNEFHKYLTKVQKEWDRDYCDCYNDNTPP